MQVNEEARYFNALNVVLGGNYRALQSLAEKHVSWERAWQTLDRSALETENLWNKVLEVGARVLLRDDPEFPFSLRQIHAPPFGLYVRGKSLNLEKAVAIVGTRRATYEGRILAASLAEDFVRAGFAVVSGLALGIDAAAHEGAVRAGGPTVGVIASGVDIISPRQNERLGESLLDCGAIVSEYPCGADAKTYRFLERNRIVSGLTLGVIVVEAPESSGALVTARFALEQGRDVFVVPGNIRHPNYRGSHALIKSGAALITEVRDVLLGLGFEDPKTVSGQVLNKVALDEKEKLVITVLQSLVSGCSLDYLVEQTGFEVAEISRRMTGLLFKGVVRENSGKFYAL